MKRLSDQESRALIASDPDYHQVYREILNQMFFECEESPPIVDPEVIEPSEPKVDAPHIQVVAIRPDGTSKQVFDAPFYEGVMQRGMAYAGRTGYTVRILARGVAFTFKKGQAWEFESPRFFRITTDGQTTRWTEFEPDATSLYRCGGARNYAFYVSLSERVDIQVTCRQGYKVHFSIEGWPHG